MIGQIIGGSIIAAAIVGSAVIQTYYSPFQSCVRVNTSQMAPESLDSETWTNINNLSIRYCVKELGAKNSN